MTRRLHRILGSFCAFVALSTGLLAGEIAGPLPLELEPLVTDIAAVPDPFAFDLRDPRKDVNVWDRKQAAVLEGCRMGSKVWPAIPALVSLTGHPTIQVSVAAATILASVKTEEHPRWNHIQEQLRSTANAHTGFEYLVRGRDEGLRPYDNRRRKFAVQALGIIGPTAHPAGPTLLRLLESNAELDVPLWCDAAASLRNMAMDDGDYLPILRRRFTGAEEDLAVRTTAAQALACARAGDAETLAALRRGLEASYSQVRLAASRALLLLGVPFAEVQPTLLALLGHKLVSIRTGTLRVLTEIGPRAAPLRSEVTRLVEDPAPSVREAAQAALEAL